MHMESLHANPSPLNSMLQDIIISRKKKITQGPCPGVDSRHFHGSTYSLVQTSLVVTFMTRNSREAYNGLQKTVKKQHHSEWGSLSRRDLCPHSVFMMRSNLHNLFYVQHIPQPRMLPFKESNLLLQQIFTEYLLYARY